MQNQLNKGAAVSLWLVEPSLGQAIMILKENNEREKSFTRK